MKKTGFLLIAIIAMLSACSSSKDTVKMTIASEKRMAVGVAPMEVLLVKEGDATDWSFFHSNIEGFDFQSGYEYVLKVRKEERERPLPADISSIRYILVKEISRTAKTSENMPSDIVAAKEFVWTGRVLDINNTDIGRGAAAGRFPVKVLKIEVTALNSRNLPFKEGDIIHAELLAEPGVTPVKDSEYVFRARGSHPAHALGVYMLNTDVRDLTQ